MPQHEDWMGFTLRLGTRRSAASVPSKAPKLFWWQCPWTCAVEVQRPKIEGDIFAPEPIADQDGAIRKPFGLIAWQKRDELIAESE